MTVQPFDRYVENVGVDEDGYCVVCGFPFEVARADEVFTFYQQRGFTLKTLRTTSNLGNNQFVFVKTPNAVMEVLSQCWTWP